MIGWILLGIVSFGLIALKARLDRRQQRGFTTVSTRIERSDFVAEGEARSRAAAEMRLSGDEETATDIESSMR